MSDDAAVVVVGAGPTGAVVARRLAEAGVDVLCLERGGDPPAPPDPSLWELAGRGALTESPELRGGPADYPLDSSASDVAPMIWNGVGGGSILWGAQWERFLASDLEVRTRDGVADDWPLRYTELAPLYDRLDRDFGVAALAGDPAFPPGGNPAHPPLPLPPAAARVARAHDRLGWHWWPGPNAIAPTCTMRGSCATGCPEGAKLTVDRSHWPAARAAGARLLTWARAVRLVASGGRVREVIWVDAGGAERRSRAEVVVLAAGAIGTARLLLASADTSFPDGLANGSGLVGRNLMLHPFTRVAGIFGDETGDTAHAIWGQMIHCLQFAESDPSRGLVRGTKWNLGPAGGPLTAALQEIDGEPGWGAGVGRRVRDWTGHAVVWGITADDLPEPSNRVELDSATADASGMPGVRIHYRVSDGTQALLDAAVPRARESLEAAGAEQTIAFRRLRAFGWHQLGTARMGTDPSASVVDPYSRAHELPNLVVADASVFVTGSSVNPTATACALALRAAEHLLSAGVPARGAAGTGPGARYAPAAEREPEPEPEPEPGPAAAEPTPPPAQVSDAVRERIAELAGALVPAEAGLPSGHEALQDPRPLDTALRLIPRLASALAVAGELTGEPAPGLAALERDRPGAFAALRELVLAAWSIAPGVRAALGYAGAVPRARGDLEAPAPRALGRR